MQELQPLAQPQLSQQLVLQLLQQLFLHLNRSNRQKLLWQQLGWQLLQHEGAQPQAGSQQAGAQPQAGSQQACSQPQAGSQQAGAQPQAGSQQACSQPQAGSHPQAGSQQLLQLFLQQPPNRPAKMSGVLQQYCWQGLQQGSQAGWQQLDSHPQEGSQQDGAQPQDGSHPQAGSQQVLQQPCPECFMPNIRSSRSKPKLWLVRAALIISAPKTMFHFMNNVSFTN